VIVVGIDHARTSGYGIVRAHPVTPVVLEHGVARSLADRAVVVAHALAAGGDDEDVWVVLEDHSYLPARSGRNAATLIGMGDARGRWRERFELAGLPKARMRFSVQPKVWRRAVLGLSDYASEERCKQTAVRYAEGLTGAVGMDHNAAEGLCIAVWGGRNLPALLEHEKLQRAAKRAMGVAGDAGAPDGLHGGPSGAATPVGTRRRGGRHEAHRGRTGARGGRLPYPPA